jgi:hypothetical protein
MTRRGVDRRRVFFASKGAKVLLTTIRRFVGRVQNGNAGIITCRLKEM